MLPPGALWTREPGTSAPRGRSQDTGPSKRKLRPKKACREEDIGPEEGCRGDGTSRRATCLADSGEGDGAETVACQIVRCGSPNSHRRMRKRRDESRRSKTRVSAPRSVRISSNEERRILTPMTGPGGTVPSRPAPRVGWWDRHPCLSLLASDGRS